MNTEWDKYEPAPIEFMHGLLIEEFHLWRKTKTENTTVEITGNDLNNIIAKVKLATYKKYKVLHLDKVVLKETLNK